MRSVRSISKHGNSLRGVSQSSLRPQTNQLRPWTRCASQACSQSSKLSRGLRASPSPSSLMPRLSTKTTVRHGSSSAASSEDLRKSPLHELHLAHGGKMVPYGGYSMPVSYPSLSVSASHNFTRTQASLFDVSHMVQRHFGGPGAAKFLQRVTPSDLEGLQPNHSTLSALLVEDGSGGIVDDTVITKIQSGDEVAFYVVTNAACRDKDNAYFEREVNKWNDEGNDKVTHTIWEDRGLIALQGPGSVEILSQVLSKDVDLTKLFFGQSARVETVIPQLQGGAADPFGPFVSRGGYTGEDGFEISVHKDGVTAFAEALLAAGPDKIQLAGLGARDSLRLEAGMCLYGNDIDETTTPVEAGLSWIIPKARRSADAGFYGADVVAQQLVPRSKGGRGVERRRVGLLVEGAPAREGVEIVARGGDEKLGAVTSGCPSPTLGKNVAMGYIKDGSHKAGTEVDVLVRGKRRKATVTKMPFVQTKYWKGTAPA